ncbi:hypothetical protein L211DRAFT_247882 [Terfezia boudieri ATCC MYA-4762]|uniref:Uncharacterized protein n=1 Tax=Terfezia boudieri ATCC MYA-4762 TaxID=1051890 RepID=A0A3N4M1I2_9PEZI|nr:hypothetical protein L211DRAFT_247882 [Terfezia boudieri ATCC MYA-4762]
MLLAAEFAFLSIVCVFPLPHRGFMRHCLLLLITQLDPVIAIPHDSFMFCPCSLLPLFVFVCVFRYWIGRVGDSAGSWGDWI